MKTHQSPSLRKSPRLRKTSNIFHDNGSVGSKNSGNKKLQSSSGTTLSKLSFNDSVHDENLRMDTNIRVDDLSVDVSVQSYKKSNKKKNDRRTTVDSTDIKWLLDESSLNGSNMDQSEVDINTSSIHNESNNNDVIVKEQLYMEEEVVISTHESVTVSAIEVLNTSTAISDLSADSQNHSSATHTTSSASINYIMDNLYSSSAGLIPNNSSVFNTSGSSDSVGYTFGHQSNNNRRTTVDTADIHDLLLEEDEKSVTNPEPVSTQKFSAKKDKNRRMTVDTMDLQDLLDSSSVNTSIHSKNHNEGIVAATHSDMSELSTSVSVGEIQRDNRRMTVDSTDMRHLLDEESTLSEPANQQITATNTAANVHTVASSKKTNKSSAKKNKDRRMTVDVMDLQGLLDSSSVNNSNHHDEGLVAAANETTHSVMSELSTSVSVVRDNRRMTVDSTDMRHLLDEESILSEPANQQITATNTAANVQIHGVASSKKTNKFSAKKDKNRRMTVDTMDLQDLLDSSSVNTSIHSKNHNEGIVAVTHSDMSELSTSVSVAEIQRDNRRITVDSTDMQHLLDEESTLGEPANKQPIITTTITMDAAPSTEDQPFSEKKKSTKKKKATDRRQTVDTMDMQHLLDELDTSNAVQTPTNDKISTYYDQVCIGPFTVTNPATNQSISTANQYNQHNQSCISELSMDDFTMMHAAADQINGLDNGIEGSASKATDNVHRRLTIDSIDIDWINEEIGNLREVSGYYSKNSTSPANQSTTSAASSLAPLQDVLAMETSYQLYPANTSTEGKDDTVSQLDNLSLSMTQHSSSNKRKSRSSPGNTPQRKIKALRRHSGNKASMLEESQIHTPDDTLDSLLNKHLININETNTSSSIAMHPPQTNTTVDSSVNISQILNSTATNNYAAIKPIKSCLSSTKKKPKHSQYSITNSAVKSVVFGSPQAVEFNKLSPTNNLTPLDRKKVKEMFKLPAANNMSNNSYVIYEDDASSVGSNQSITHANTQLNATAANDIDAVTLENERILKQWETLSTSKDVLNNSQQAMDASNNEEFENDYVNEFFSQHSTGPSSPTIERDDNVYTTNDLVNDSADDLIDRSVDQMKKTKRRRSKLQPVILDESNNIPAESNTAEDDSNYVLTYQTYNKDLDRMVLDTTTNKSAFHISANSSYFNTSVDNVTHTIELPSNLQQLMMDTSMEARGYQASHTANMKANTKPFKPMANTIKMDITNLSSSILDTTNQQDSTIAEGEDEDMTEDIEVNLQQLIYKIEDKHSFYQLPASSSSAADEPDISADQESRSSDSSNHRLSSSIIQYTSFTYSEPNTSTHNSNASQHNSNNNSMSSDDHDLSAFLPAHTSHFIQTYTAAVTAEENKENSMMSDKQPSIHADDHSEGEREELVKDLEQLRPLAPVNNFSILSDIQEHENEEETSTNASTHSVVKDIAMDECDLSAIQQDDYTNTYSTAGPTATVDEEDFTLSFMDVKKKVLRSSRQFDQFTPSVGRRRSSLLIPPTINEQSTVNTTTNTAANINTAASTNTTLLQKLRSLNNHTASSDPTDPPTTSSAANTSTVMSYNDFASKIKRHSLSTKQSQQLSQHRLSLSSNSYNVLAANHRVESVKAKIAALNTNNTSVMLTSSTSNKENIAASSKLVVTENNDEFIIEEEEDDMNMDISSHNVNHAVQRVSVSPKTMIQQQMQTIIQQDKFLTKVFSSRTAAVEEPTAVVSNLIEVDSVTYQNTISNKHIPLQNKRQEVVLQESSMNILARLQCIIGIVNHLSFYQVMSIQPDHLVVSFPLIQNKVHLEVTFHYYTATSEQESEYYISNIQSKLAKKQDIDAIAEQQVEMFFTKLTDKRRRPEEGALLAAHSIATVRKLRDIPSFLHKMSNEVVELLFELKTK